jgi:hypothetical protein
MGLTAILDEARGSAAYTSAFEHFDRLRSPAFAPDVEPYLQKIERAAS